MLNDTLFVQQSLINHLFYLRSIKSYCLNIQLSFYENENSYSQTAEEFRKTCDSILKEVLEMVGGKYLKDALDSQIFLTDFTFPCAKLTEDLFDVVILNQLSKDEILKKAMREVKITKDMLDKIDLLNKRALVLTTNFVDFCKHIYKQQRDNKLFSYSYPSIFLYIIEDVLLYQKELERLISKSGVDPIYVQNYEFFFSDSSRQASSFLKGFSDPTQKRVIEQASYFEIEFGKLQLQHNKANLNPDESQRLRNETIILVKEYQAFYRDIISRVLSSNLYFIVEALFLDILYAKANYFLYLLLGANISINKEKIHKN